MITDAQSLNTPKVEYYERKQTENFAESEKTLKTIAPILALGTYAIHSMAGQEFISGEQIQFLSDYVAYGITMGLLGGSSIGFIYNAINSRERKEKQKIEEKHRREINELESKLMNK